MLPTAQNHTTKPEFFTLALQWPDGFCNQTHMPVSYPNYKVDRDFKIHGLWPEFTGFDLPDVQGRSQSLQLREVKELLGRLNQNWPSFTGPNKNLWIHEWMNHGIYSGFDKYEYFDKTLRLRENIDILGSLREEGICPDGTCYSLRSIQETVQKVTGFIPKLRWENNELYEILICMDKSATRFTDWPTGRGVSLFNSKRSAIFPMCTKSVPTRYLR